MQQIDTIAALRAQVAEWRSRGEKVAFVPTMGNLHAGHLALVEQAKRLAPRVVVSIFVNPLQFGPGEDFDRYPRTLAQDSAALTSVGPDLLFAPPVEEVYPDGGHSATTVSVAGVSEGMCGEFRPGHFAGVATVVAKLFNMVQPDLALFGEKDYQQLQVIRRMAKDLCFDVEIVGVETRREADGLALSSRNGYLSAEERELAPALYGALQAVAGAIKAGERGYSALSQGACVALQAAGFRPEYVAVRDADTLVEADEDSESVVVLAAAYLGKTRLIDNVRLSLVK